VIALLRSEALRIRSRRLVWVLAVLALIGIGVACAIVAVKSHPGEIATFPPSGTTYQVATLPDTLRGTAFFLIVLGLVIGASSVGADWQTGSMTTLLTWERRRGRVLVARALTVSIVVFALVVGLQTILSGLLWVVASTRGTTAGADVDWLHHVVGLILRVGVMAVVGALLGISISMIGRGTAAALGVIFVYLALLESLMRAIIPKLTPYLLATNAVVFVDGHAGSPATATIITMTRATITVLAYAGALVLAAFAFFRLRDVT
jgi:ABC-type transport system involved in multi-copper enzyme maturation permease subunit